jgi:SAM-dependent methyltransferase
MMAALDHEDRGRARMTDLTQFQHPRFARRYIGLSDRLEELGVGDLRRELLAGLHGCVVDVGCGDGKNFRHYAATVTRVVAVEPDDLLRRHAEGNAARAAVPVEVVAGHADDLPVATASADAVVMTLVLCSVPDLHSALAEVNRVLRPGGELRFGEHVRAQNRLAALAQGAITPLSRRVDGNCHQNRDTAAAVQSSPLTVTSLRRFGMRVVSFLPGQPMIAGTAVKPPART